MSPEVEEVVVVRRQTIARLKRLVRDALQLPLEPEDIDEDSPLFGFGLGLDSIDALSLVIAIEEQFQVSVADDYARIFRSLNTVADHILSANRLAVMEDA